MASKFIGKKYLHKIKVTIFVLLCFCLKDIEEKMTNLSFNFTIEHNVVRS